MRDQDITKVEFLLMCNENIVVQRFFNVKGFNKTAHKSEEFYDYIKSFCNELQYNLKMRSIVYMLDNQYEIFDFSGTALEVPLEKADKLVVVPGKGDYQHFMLKEIYEQKQAILRTLYEYKSGQTIQERLGLSTEKIKELEEITIVGCGTSFHAGLIGQFFLESIAKVPTIVQLG